MDSYVGIFCVTSGLLKILKSCIDYKSEAIIWQGEDELSNIMHAAVLIYGSKCNSSCLKVFFL